MSKKRKKSSIKSVIYKPEPLNINEEELIQKHLVSGIVYNRKEAMISIMNIHQRPGIEGYLFGALTDAKILVDMITQNGKKNHSVDLTFTIPRLKYKKTMKVIEQIAHQLGEISVFSDLNVAKLSLTGIGMRSHSKVGYTMFKALGEQNIIIKMITTSEIKISIIIDEQHLKLATKSLRQTFNLDRYLLDKV